MQNSKRLLPAFLLIGAFFLTSVLFGSCEAASGESSPVTTTGSNKSMPPIIRTSKATTSSPIIIKDMMTEKIKVIFSDVDGTLVHYHNQEEESKVKDIVHLPPSSTGMQGIISRETLNLVTKLREKKPKQVKFVLVSGMRSTTLLQRIPFLPRADAYCSESGGRIFYPQRDIENDDYGDDDGAFTLQEDMGWRQIMQHDDAAGKDGYGCNLDGVVASKDDVISTVPIEERKGLLWEFAKMLIHRGWNVDYKGYATSFRIKFRADLSSGGSPDELRQILPSELSCSVNLGMSDVYPNSSGKVKCCEYLSRRFGAKSLREECICICDDDNDIEMALACGHAYLPSMTSDSMMLTVQTNSDHFTVACSDGVSGTDATDAALRAILEQFY